MSQAHLLVKPDARAREHAPLISIVVPTFNRAEWLPEALESLTRQRTDGRFTYEVIVVDNASSDATREVVEGFASAVPVRYVYQEKPGDAPTRNQGVAAAAGEWVAFFDDDELAKEDWLLELYSAALQARAFIVGGAVHLHLTEEQSRRLGGICRGALRELKPYRDLQAYSGKLMPGCGNAIVAREVFDRIGTFDTTLVNGGSDTDFFLRARRGGYMPWYTPKAVILHRVPPSRLSVEYFRWDALQGGDNIATHDFRRCGRARMVPLGIARAGQAALVHLPLLILGWIRRDPGAVLGRRTRLWRAEGYLRKTLALLAPRVFPQHRFFKSLEFRSGRTFG
jgi:glycosyltransferase involved in cell wall biosynthesis